MASIPPILKHMTLAIFNSGYVKGPVRLRFQIAFRIARARCLKYGYMVGSGVDFKDTGKALKHRREGLRGWTKDRMFDGMFSFIARREVEKKPETDNQGLKNVAHTMGPRQKR